MVPTAAITGLLRDGSQWRRLHVPQPSVAASADRRRGAVVVHRPQLVPHEDAPLKRVAALRRDPTTTGAQVHEVATNRLFYQTSSDISNEKLLHQTVRYYYSIAFSL